MGVRLERAVGHPDTRQACANANPAPHAPLGHEAQRAHLPKTKVFTVGKLLRAKPTRATYDGRPERNVARQTKETKHESVPSRSFPQAAAPAVWVPKPVKG